jgi:hypothetical protein
MRDVATDDEWVEELAFLYWLGQFPWTQWYINRLRREEGLPPFRHDRPPLDRGEKDPLY